MYFISKNKLSYGKRKLMKACFFKNKDIQNFGGYEFALGRG